MLQYLFNQILFRKPLLHTSRFKIVLSKVSLVSPEEGSDINRLVRFVSDSLNTRGVLLSKVLKVFVSSLVVVVY